MIVRGSFCLTNTHFFKSPKNFTNLLFSKSLTTKIRQDAVVSDHTVCWPRPGVETEETCDISLAPAQKGACAYGFGILKYVSVSLFPIFLFKFPELRVGFDDRSITLIE